MQWVVLLHIWDVSGSNMSQETSNADCFFFHIFCKSLQVNPGIVYQIRPQLLLSICVPVHYS